jgi:hypothetical protein
MAKPQYGYDHQKERAQANARLEVLGPIPCRHCGRLVYCDKQRHLNRDGRKFQLGHGVAHAEGGTGDDKQPEHCCCNEAAGGRLAHARAKAREAIVEPPIRGTRHWM